MGMLDKVLLISVNPLPPPQFVKHVASTSKSHPKPISSFFEPPVDILDFGTLNDIIHSLAKVHSEKFPTKHILKATKWWE